MAFDDDTYGWAYAPPSHLEGEPGVPVPDKPPGAEIAPNQRVHLPSGVVAYRQTYAEHDRLAALDAQREAARRAAEQAAMDAQMYNQMMRVAQSTKDIEIARRNIDMMGLQRDVRSGVPIHQAVQRHPMALGSGFGGALRATAPAPAAVPPSKLELPGMPPAIQTTDRYGQRHVQFPPAPPISLMQPEARTAQPITSPEGKTLGYDIGGGKTLAEPKPPPEGKLTDQQRAQLTDLRKQRDAVIREMEGVMWEGKLKTPSMAGEVAKTRANFERLNAQIGKLTGAEAPPPTDAKPVAVTGQGTKTDPARPETPEQFASMPAGTWFINPKDGKLMQKK